MFYTFPKTADVGGGSSELTLRILTSVFVHLREWASVDLRAPYWRFYWNETAGASIIADKKTIPLGPSCFVLIPPETSFTTAMESDTHHFYVHFLTSLTWTHAAPDESANPLQRQVNRLAYLLGTASARTYPQGLISFDRSFFFVQGHDNAALRCVVAHELTHFLHRHAYLSSRREQQADLRAAPQPQRARRLASLSQQQELAADRGALLMTAIAGHDPAACIRQLQEAAELDGDYAAEDPDGSHPGHARRLAAARAYVRQGLAADLAAWRHLPHGPPVVPIWHWDAQDKVLTVRTRS